VIEVPATAGRFIPVHQIPEPLPLPAVEIFHPQTVAVAGPNGEVVAVA
jgi:hypothetical protein